MGVIQIRLLGIKQLSLSIGIGSSIELLFFRLEQISVDHKGTEPKEGYGEEWERVKDTQGALLEIYKRLDTDNLMQELDEKEKLYDIIAYVLQCSGTLFLDRKENGQLFVTLDGVPDGQIRHSLELVLEGNDHRKSIISYRFF